MKIKNFPKKHRSASRRFSNFSLVGVVVAAFSFLFYKKTILFVGKKKIRTINIGAFPQIIFVLLIAYFASSLINSMRYDKIVDEKSQEIEKLKELNVYFEKEFTDMSDRLEKVNEYLISINGKKHVVKFQETIDGEYKRPRKLNTDNLSRQDKHTFNQVKEINQQLSSIHNITQERIRKIEKAMEITGLNMKKIEISKLKMPKIKEVSLNEKGSLKKAQGGPFVPLKNLDQMASVIFTNGELLEKKLQKSKFGNDFDYLMILENLVEVMPFAKPMKNYYISSGFGSRIDPLTNRMATHEGLDFVGQKKEKILSPSAGRVVLAGRFSDYGNAIVIDHGFGITTRYGHLSEVKVKNGDKVKQGDVIALQGNSGRSTGSHLHYEIRYKNIPLNPKRFLEAGNYIINDGKANNYVDS